MVSTRRIGGRPTLSVAGWSSPVARQAHNLKVAGSNPAPATSVGEQRPEQAASGRLCSFWGAPNASNPANSPTSSIVYVPSSGISLISDSSPRMMHVASACEEGSRNAVVKLATCFRYTSDNPGCSKTGGSSDAELMVSWSSDLRTSNAVSLSFMLAWNMPSLMASMRCEILCSTCARPRVALLRSC